MDVRLPHATNNILQYLGRIDRQINASIGAIINDPVNSVQRTRSDNGRGPARDVGIDRDIRIPNSSSDARSLASRISELLELQFREQLGYSLLNFQSQRQRSLLSLFA